MEWMNGERSAKKVRPIEFQNKVSPPMRWEGGRDETDGQSLLRPIVLLPIRLLPRLLTPREKGREDEREEGRLLRRTLGNAVACCRSRARHGQRRGVRGRDRAGERRISISYSAPLCLALPVPFPSVPPSFMPSQKTDNEALHGSALQPRKK